MSSSGARVRDETSERLRRWAAGSYPAEAGVELLVRSGVLRRVDLSGLWGSEQGVDAEVLSGAVLDAHLTDHELPLVLVALSLLAGGDHAVDLSQVLPGVDRHGMDLVLAAVAHAGGSHADRAIERNEYGNATGGIGRRLPPLHPWP